MSGNPFRASLVLQNHPAAAPPTSFPPADSSIRRDEGDYEREIDSVLDASSAPAKTKKTVRIESPTETLPPHPEFGHVDNETSYGIGRGRRTASPPPELPAAIADEFEERYPQDPTRQQVDERGILGDVWTNTSAHQSATSPSGAPANPFSRTLATLELREKGGDTAAQSRGERITDKGTPGPKRQSLNVEGFKNLLMQGITSPRSSAPPPNVPAPSSNPLSPAVFESSSSTDTSSLSRQSIFDIAQEPHPESSRTSYDMVASDDEHAGLVGGETPKKEKKKPPPAPRHRHGKLVKERTPQTVPFEGFSAAETTPELKLPKRTNSDLNKPLPPTPPTAVSAPAHIVSQDTTHDPESISERRDSETVSIAETTPTQTSTHKKIPPPVPLARRQSQLRSSTGGNRSRSNSSLTMSSQHSIDIHGQESTSTPSTTSKAPPPPPPSRRHGNALSTMTTSSANSSSTELSTSARPAVTSPNRPSSRRTTLTSEPSSPVPGLTRTSSKHSTRTSSRAVSSETTNPSLPPPPPPPRRRQSGRSSLDMQRPSMPHQGSSPVGSRHTSNEYKRNSRSSIDGKRQGSIASVSSLSREYTPADKDEVALYSPREEVEEPEPPSGEGGSGALSGGVGPAVEAGEADTKRKDGSNASNILDDMEKFQREIDELRERYKKAA